MGSQDADQVWPGVGDGLAKGFTQLTEARNHQDTSLSQVDSSGWVLADEVAWM